MRGRVGTDTTVAECLTDPGTLTRALADEAARLERERAARPWWKVWKSALPLILTEVQVRILVVVAEQMVLPGLPAGSVERLLLGRALDRAGVALRGD